MQQELLLREAEECTFHPRTNHAQPTLTVPRPDSFFERSQKWADKLEAERDAALSKASAAAATARYAQETARQLEAETARAAELEAELAQLRQQIVTKNLELLAARSQRTQRAEEAAAAATALEAQIRGVRDASAMAARARVSNQGRPLPRC